MNKLIIILGIIFVLTMLVGAAVYTEPWSSNQDANDYGVAGLDYLNFTDGGYIYDNGTTLVIGRS